MALVGKVGRRRIRARFAMVLLYGVLIIGAVTTVYPFLLMASTGFKGASDQDDGKMVPQYWSVVSWPGLGGLPAKESLLGKYLLDKYSGDEEKIRSTRIGTSVDPTGYESFLLGLPVGFYEAGFRTQTGQVTGRLAERYQSWLRARYRDLEKLNHAYLEEDTAFQTVVPPAEMLARKDWHAPQSLKYQDWTLFKSQLPAEFRIPITEQGMFQDFMRSKFKNQFSAVSPTIAAGAASFAQLKVPSSGPLLAEFKRTSLPVAFARETIESFWAKVHSGPLPVDSYETQFVRQHAGELRREFASRNYRYVLDYVAINGRSLWNTVIFCVLAILTQLIVNPLAAYALARYPISATGKILLFLLATMAFPAEVAMIPSFLLLKQFHLLNTFSALVLPTAASGYMIFLLKGFFDSLPKELYEAGQIDGAREITMMMRIALPLSKPVLGYIALMAFMAAYGSFLYAFLVAQDQRIWTLMVWVYNLQTYAPKAVTMAALVIAALPTLLVFLLAQNVIMKGIILPGER
ncbi:MAG TPA: ABC transporter permease subunit [Fimbriimonadaceae bacterium]|jgi:multiple sugar transport system permease protein